jgi:hypothetical protein
MIYSIYYINRFLVRHAGHTQPPPDGWFRAEQDDFELIDRGGGLGRNRFNVGNHAMMFCGDNLTEANEGNEEK